MLGEFEDDEERFIRTELELQKTHDEMIGNKDFQYLLQKSQELFGLYYPIHSRGQGPKKDDFLVKVMTEVTKQLFSNEIGVIAGLTGHYNERIENI